jgi:hypothetical protein
VALLTDTILIASAATEPQLRVGFIAVGLVLAYLAGIHFVPSPLSKNRHLPKEFQAGLIFAFGVSLNSWAHISSDHSFQLLLTTVITGILFALNCLVVASWESNTDSQQGFSSLVNRFPNASGRHRGWLQTGVLGYSGFALTLGIANVLPMRVAIFLCVASCCLYLVLCNFPKTHKSTPPGLRADAAIAIAPTLWLLLGALS